MKKLFLFCGFMIPFMHLAAQSYIPSGNSTNVKLTDVVSNYKKIHPNYGIRNNGFIKSILPGLSLEENEGDYQFDRWLWYWRQHTDPNGYLVSPAKDMQELEKLKTQERNGSTAKTSGVSPAWVFVGPDSSEVISEGQGQGVGRINMVAFHPTDSNIFWVGTPGGGAWKTTNGGMSWTCMTDQLPVLSISDIVFNPLNPNTIYLCTGDRDAGDYSGIGILKSYDGGTTWNTTGMSWAASDYKIANAMIINPLDTNSLVLATNNGMYRSYDGAASFTKVDTGDFTQVLYSPNDTNVVYAASYLSYQYYPSITYAQIWRSADGGNTWNQQTTLTTSYRITLAITPVAQDMVLAISAAYDPSGSNMFGLDGIYKSSDTGNTFTEIYSGGCFGGNLLTWDASGDGCAGQGWYTLPLAISLTDSNTVITGGVNTWSSSDGGNSWSLLNQEVNEITGFPVIHADKHFFAFNPLAPTTLYETNDGGIFSSYNPLVTNTWKDLTNRMGIEEIYRASVSNIDSFEITGAQDVGTKVERGKGVSEEAVGGDGMQCLLDFADSNVAYGESEYGYISRLNPAAFDPIISSTDISGNILSGTIEGTGSWVTPYVLEPTCHTCILAGYNSIYLSTDKGETWNAISYALTTNNLSRVVTTIADSNTIFATEDYYSQNIYYTHDGGSNWNTLTPPASYGVGYELISDIKIDPKDKDHIWVTYSGYGTEQVAEWYSTTGWHLLNTGLPDVPVSCFAVDYISRDLYIGTEIGVYYRDSTMSYWEPYTTGMPRVDVTDLEINYTTNQIWAATYGRSLWKSPKHTFTVDTIATDTNSAVSIIPFIANSIIISPNPNHGSFTVTVKNIADKNVDMRLIDNSGKTAWKNNGVIRNSKISVTTNELTSGTYIFEISSNGIIEGRQKVLIY